MLFKNIKLLIKKDPFLAFIFLITQIIAVVILLFGYGMFMNVQYELNNTLDESKSYDFFSKEYAGKSFVHAQEVKEAFPEFLKGYDELIDTVIVFGTALTDKGKKGVRNDFSLVNNNGTLEYGIGKIDIESIKPYVNGEWFTSKDYNEGTHQVIIPYVLRSVSEDKIVINDEEFNVRTYEEDEVSEMEPWAGMASTIIMPLEAMPDEMNIDSISINFKNPISLKVYNELCDKFGELYDGKLEKPEYVKIDIKDTDSLKSMQYSSIGIAIMAAITVCLIIRYIIRKRTRMSAIYRIIGETNTRLIMSYFLEILINLVISIIIGMELFFGVIKKLMLKNYQWLNVIFEDYSYVKFLVIYGAILIISSLIVVIWNCRKSPYELLVLSEE